MKQLRKKLLHFFKIVISISLPTNPSIFNINKFKIYVSQLKNTVSFILNQKLYKMKHLMMNEMQNGFIKSLLQWYQETFHKSTPLLQIHAQHREKQLEFLLVNKNIRKSFLCSVIVMDFSFLLRIFLSFLGSIKFLRMFMQSLLHLLTL